mmetsp:Transcript_67676/g.133585  ORF Transcript_67676/g.133585 Transcript_67676/m.133585 type:complete len:97 (+) Transcript_67676:97-387(+)
MAEKKKNVKQQNETMLSLAKSAWAKMKSCTRKFARKNSAYCYRKLTSVSSRDHEKPSASPRAKQQQPRPMLSLLPADDILVCWRHSASLAAFRTLG